MKSEGKCRVCEKTSSSAGMLRHIKTHFKKFEIANTKHKPSYLVRVKDKYYPLFFLYILVPGDLKLADLDNFLRGIWLECCGHMSSFNPKGSYIGSNEFEMEDEFGLSLKFKIGETLLLYGALDYEYDFGSTSHLTIEPLKELFLPLSATQKKTITVLARNEMPHYDCGTCGKKVDENGFYCMECEIEHNKSPYLCKNCEENHKCNDYCEPVLMANSPRMGLCAYEGGFERDVYEKISIKDVNT